MYCTQQTSDAEFETVDKDHDIRPDAPVDSLRTLAIRCEGSERAAQLRTAAMLVSEDNRSRAVEILEVAMDGAPRGIWAGVFPVYARLAS